MKITQNKFGVAHLSQISIRETASHCAQLVSQLLFGDAYQVIDIEDNWVKIVTFDDKYEGYIDKKLWNPLHEADASVYPSLPKYFVTDYLIFIKEFETNVTFPVFMGSSFPFPKDNLLILGNAIFVIEIPVEGNIPQFPNLSVQQSALLQFASGYLRAPYLWGGKTPAGIDCSAFVQLAYKSIHISLPRDASQQSSFGDSIDFSTEWQVGDLAFFDNEEGKITHVGMICGNSKIMHASGFVRIDSIDQTGIYNQDLEQYTHKLRIVKRTLNPKSKI